MSDIQANIDQDLTFSTRFSAPSDPNALADGYNEYGVKEVHDQDGNLERVEFIFEAMQPGDPEDRNGFDIGPEFLANVAGHDYSSEVPFQMSHDKDQRSNAGYIDQVWFSDDALRVHGYVPNTGNALRSDVIADLTHRPPALRDGSVGFGRSFDYEITDDGVIRPTDGVLQEFSATPFPGGYDNGGGLKAQFMQAAQDAGVLDEAPSDVSGAEGTRAEFSRLSVHTVEYEI
ncbi:hypothetical protein [Halorubellus litoreus]|uniref:Prohead serine protease n=1 Tax=Halorubellus litoreus TaxID=755308 RepID=A0ABD5VI50_9EURY